MNLALFDFVDFDQLHACGDTREDLDLPGIASRKYFGWQEVV